MTLYQKKKYMDLGGAEGVCNPLKSSEDPP
jgi:hypothetical protein